MPAVAGYSPSASSLVDQPSTTSDPTAADSFTVNSTASPSAATPGSTDTPSSFSMVPTALSATISTPVGSVVPVMVTLKVSCASPSVSSVVSTEKVASVLPAAMVTLPPVTAV